jgi:hypothetical protein
MMTESRSATISLTTRKCLDVLDRCFPDTGKFGNLHDPLAAKVLLLLLIRFMKNGLVREEVGITSKR